MTHVAHDPWVTGPSPHTSASLTQIYRLLGTVFGYFICIHTHLSCYIYTIAHVRKLHTQAPVNLEFANRKLKHCITLTKLECGPMLNVMVALPNTGGALCSTSQSLA